MLMDDDTSYLDEAVNAPAAPDALPGAESTQVRMTGVKEKLNTRTKVISRSN